MCDWKTQTAIQVGFPHLLQPRVWRARHSKRHVTDSFSVSFCLTGDARGYQSWGRGLLGDQAGRVETQAISLRIRAVRAHQQAPVPSNGWGSLEKCQPGAFVSAPIQSRILSNSISPALSSNCSSASSLAYQQLHWGSSHK